MYMYRTNTGLVKETSTSNCYLMYSDCWFYYLIQFDRKSMVEVQLTGNQFCHYFFMRLSAENTKCHWHIANTAKGITVLQILYLLSIVCICTCNWYMYPCNSLWQVHKSTYTEILLTLIAVIAMFPDHKG